MPKDPLKFEILCVDSSNSSKVQNREQLLYSLASNSDLWSSPHLNQLKYEIDGNDLSVAVRQVDATRASEFVPQRAFLINAEGEFDALENFRLPLVTHLKTQNIGLVYILKDEISETIAREIYPLINKIESRLRGYLIKFFVTKLGPDWWRLTADAEMRKKAYERRNNEIVFSKFVDNNAYLIDFAEIGKIVYTQSSGFLDKEAIVERVMKLEPTAEAIEALQRDLETNYSKFFKETFKDNDFQAKWIQLAGIRHKVAHSNLFTKDDLDAAKEIYESLRKIIEIADEGIDDVVFSQDETIAVEEVLSENLPQPEDYRFPFSPIDEATLLRELATREEYSNKRGGYVGLGHFVTMHLGPMEYDYAASFDVINSLVRRGIIEIYDTTSMAGHPAKAIRLVQKSGDGQAANVKPSETAEVAQSLTASEVN